MEEKDFDNTDEEISLFAKRFASSLKKTWKNQSLKGKNRGDKANNGASKPIICFKYKKEGHMTRDYLEEDAQEVEKSKEKNFNRKKKLVKGFKKAMTAWEDEESLEESEEEEANLCLMDRNDGSNF